MKLREMRACWPPESAKIIGAQRSPKQKDHYGSDQPVQPFFSKFTAVIKRQFETEEARAEAVAVLGVCIVLAVAIFAFVVSVPGAIDELQTVSRQIVAENTGADRP